METSSSEDFLGNLGKDCVNLGKDFFLILFSSSEDYDKVLRGGPWFVGEHFLAIRPWEPYFKASEAKLSSMAVWVKLPDLPIEFYDKEMLKKIGKAIGLVLCIDSYIASESRGSYARLCIQIDLEKPLTKWVRVGRINQQVLYESISTLCFCCGRLGHKLENCCYRVKQTEQGKKLREEEEPASHSNGDQEDQLDQNFGLWMLVTRKKVPALNGNRLVTKLDPNKESSKGRLGNHFDNPYVVEDKSTHEPQRVDLDNMALCLLS